MVKLSELHRLVGNYLEMHGDKEITSIGTWNTALDFEYTLNLHDIFDGPISCNPYSGADKLNIPRERNAKWRNRKHVNDHLWAECSSCGFRVENYKAVTTGSSSDDYTGVLYRYCPKCGAKMSID